MNTETNIKTRRSVRRFKDDPVPHKLIEEVVDLARYAPSWKNSQIVRYIVVDDKEKIKAISSPECTLGFEYNMKTMEKAPCVLLLTYINGRSGYEKDGSFSTLKGDRWEMFDAGIAAQTFCLAAHEKGLGTVIMGIFNEEKIREILPIPEGHSLGALIPMGFPLEAEIKAPPRKERKDLLSFL